MNDTWTKETPKEPGYYWCYPSHADEPFMVEFHVNTWKDKPPSYWFLTFFTNDTFYPDTYPDALWAGPIHPPAK